MRGKKLISKGLLKKVAAVCLTAAMAFTLLAGCGSTKSTASPVNKTVKVTDSETPVNMNGIITKKKEKRALTKREIEYFVSGAADGSIPDYQLSALLMAIRLNGMTKRETKDMTLAMMKSGETIDLSSVSKTIADKHSTGGVSDGTSFIAGSLVAACGVPVSMMSGRGLGQTGGTLDKLESIPGFNVELSQKQLIKQLSNVGFAIYGQSSNMDPADKKLYSLRDVTSTVDSIPLITSSIMSKKLASGSTSLVLDVKTGNGAFMKDLKDSIDLAKNMVDCGTSMNMDVSALITDMNQPLGTHVGNSLEIAEAVDVLSNREKGNILNVSRQLASQMLISAGRANSKEEAMKLLNKVLANGSGLEKFREMIVAQGGNGKVCDDTSLLPQAKVVRTVTVKGSGFVQHMDTYALGYACQHLGGGREKVNDVIDPAVGYILEPKIGDYLHEGSTLCTIYAESEKDAAAAEKSIRDAVKIGSRKPESLKLVYAEVTSSGTIFK